MAFFDFLELGALFRREMRRHFPVRLGEKFTDAAAGVAPGLFELSGGLVDDRRNLVELLGR